MSRVTKSVANSRAAWEFALALRSGPFRVALALSLLVHLVFLVVVGRGGLGREEGGGGRIPLMRVRLLPAALTPVADPAAPARRPAVQPPRREQPVLPAAAAPDPTPASTRPAPETLAPPDGKEPESVPATSETARAAVRAEAPAQPVLVAAAPALVAEAPPPRQSQSSGMAEAPAALIPASAAPTSFASAAGVRGAGAAFPLPVAETVGSGPGGSSVAGPEREVRAAAGAAAAAADVAGVAAAEATAAPQGPGPRDLAAVRSRIEAHKVYPQIAVRNGWQGRVLVEMRLEGDGRLAAVRLLERSGYAVLDDATINAVRRAAPFPPVASVLTVPVEYRLVP